MTKKTYRILFTLILGLTVLNHLWFITRSPWDWDEPVYTNIANQAMLRGYPAFQIHSQKLDYYAFNPPVHIYLLANWFRVFRPSIQTGRGLSTIIATATVAMAMITMRVMSKSARASLLTGLMLAVDGWFAYSSLLVKFDTMSIFIGMIGILVVALALRRDSLSLALGAGMIIGFATVYKHVAGLFIIAFVLHWIFARKNSRFYVSVLSGAGIIILAYIGIMLLTVGEPFVNATAVQFRRTFGLQEARGLQYGVGQILNALLQTYWAFAGSILLAVAGSVCMFYQGFRLWRNRSAELSLIVSWGLAAAGALAAIKLRNPFYLGFLIVPVTMLAMRQIDLWLDSERRWVTNLAASLLTLLIALNLETFLIRTTEFSKVNALQETQHELRNLPENVHIISEEPICALIQQPCYPIGNNQSLDEIEKIKPEYIVIYTSVTQEVPQHGAIAALVAQSDQIWEVTGWKEHIILYRTPYNR